MPLQKLALGLTILIIIPVLYLLRSLIPESPYWLRTKKVIPEDQWPYLIKEGGNRTSVRLPPLPVRVVIGGLIGWSYTAGFTLIVLTFGPYYFPNLTNWLIFTFSVASFISGIPVSMLADRVSRKLLLLISSLGSLIISILILSLIGGLVNNQYIFWALFILFSILVNTYFLTEDTLKSEYWVTRRRGSYTAVVRVMSLGGSIPVIFLSSYLPVNSYLILAATIFGVGFAASLIWYLIGAETGKGISISAWNMSNNEDKFDLVIISDCVLDIYYRVRELPIKAGDIAVSNIIALSPGGACITALIARKLGLKVTVIDRVGDDPFSDILIKYLNDAGVHTGFMKRVRGFVTISNNIIGADDHAFMGYLGVGKELTINDVNENVIRNSRAVFINGFYASFTRDIINVFTEVIRIAHKHSVPIFLDTGPSINNTDLMINLIKSVSTVFMNEEEVKRLFGDINGLANTTRGTDVIAVVKLGSKGAAWYIIE